MSDVMFYRCELYGGLKNGFIRYFKSLDSAKSFGKKYLLSTTCGLTDHLYFEVYEVDPRSCKRVYISD